MTSSRFDGCAVLVAIAKHPTSFPALKTEIDATARKLLLRQIRATSFDLKLLQQVLSAVGESCLRLGFDEMSMKDMTSLARRLDPANASLAAMSENELGSHICALGRGDLSPQPGKKITSRTPTVKPKKELSKIGKVLHSKVHSGLPPDTEMATAADSKMPKNKRKSAEPAR